MTDKSYRFVVRSGPDRNGITTDMDGWDLASFQANPVVLLNHNDRLPPIGRAAEITVVGDQMLARIEFAPTPIAQEIERLVEQRFMVATSVGARSLEWEFTRNERGIPTGIHSHRQELVELSVVNIPADARVLRAGFDPIPMLSRMALDEVGARATRSARSTAAAAPASSAASTARSASSRMAPMLSRVISRLHRGSSTKSGLDGVGTRRSRDEFCPWTFGRPPKVKTSNGRRR